MTIFLLLHGEFATEKLQSPLWGHAAGTYCYFHFSAGRRQLAEPALAVAMCVHWPPEANPIAMLLLQMHDPWLPGLPPPMPETMAQMRRSQAIGSLQ